MKSDFTIYKASTKEPILNVPDTFLFFNILTNNLYKVFRSRQCLRYISNNQTYTYGEYRYNYIQAAGFWSSTDRRRTDYLDGSNIPQNGYIYTLEANTFESSLTEVAIPIVLINPFGNPTFNTSINNLSVTASISDITPNQFTFDVQLVVQVDSSSNYVQFKFDLKDANNLPFYSNTTVLYPETNTDPVTFSFNSLIYNNRQYPFTMGVSLSSDSEFTISAIKDRQFRIFTS